TTSLPTVRGVTWSNLESARPGTTAPLDMPEPVNYRTQAATAPPGFWGNQTQSSQEEPPKAASWQPQQTRPQIKVLQICLGIAAVILVLIFLVLISNKNTRSSMATPEPTLQPTQTPAQSATPKPDLLTVNAIDGAWEFSLNGLDSSLTIDSGVGQFVTKT